MLTKYLGRIYVLSLYITCSVVVQSNTEQLLNKCRLNNEQGIAVHRRYDGGVIEVNLR